ncbi:MAG: outer membrane protein assembly factor BamE [Pseudomonadota bacterium]
MAVQKLKTRSLRTSVAPALLLTGLALAGCSVSDTLSTSETLKQGYVIDEQTLALVPPGSSREQVLLSLGTPTTTNELDTEEAFYYISQTRQRRAQFLKPKLVDQRILAVYFDEEQKVNRIADYGVQDGMIFDFITRTTPTGGKDQTFLAQILSGGLRGSAANILGGGP